jgi:hypothetical protein
VHVGDAEAHVGDAEALAGDAESLAGDAEALAGDAEAHLRRHGAPLSPAPPGLAALSCPVLQHGAHEDGPAAPRPRRRYGRTAATICL